MYGTARNPLIFTENLLRYLEQVFFSECKQHKFANVSVNFEQQTDVVSSNVKPRTCICVTVTYFLGLISLFWS